MTNNLYIPLTNRTLIAVSSDDARQFLQGLITNDINKLSPSQAIYALMLTPQGKFLYDFFIYDYEGKILLDCNAAKLEEIKKKLSMYKLRSKVLIEDISGGYEVVALTSSSAPHPGPIGHGVGIFAADPRSPALPARAIIKKPADYAALENSGFSKGNISDYEKIRINLCIPSDADMEDSFPLEYQMDKHNAIDYQKGCYVGQEVTARTHYRGTARKKPFVATAPEGVDLAGYFGQEITSNGAKIGKMQSSAGNTGIALIRVEDFEKATRGFEVGRVTLDLEP